MKVVRQGLKSYVFVTGVVPELSLKIDTHEYSLCRDAFKSRIVPLKIGPSPPLHGGSQLEGHR